ncbi:hypothetical protein SUGI_0665260 [Cryptomeria japonica]|nr:hypothetical protein SUGI_0665260 [Cryptomeria japonica]
MGMAMPCVGIFLFIYRLLLAFPCVQVVKCEDASAGAVEVEEDEELGIVGDGVQDPVVFIMRKSMIIDILHCGMWLLSASFKPNVMINFVPSQQKGIY